LFNISKDITRPKPGTKSLPLGTSIFCGVSFVSVGLATVGDDDVLTLPDDCVFGASTGAAIPTGDSVFIAGGGSGAGGGGGGAAIGLEGFTGLDTLVGFVIDFTQVF
jgi:hypothetical protein